MTDRDVKVGDLWKKLGVTRQILYRFVGPKGELAKIRREAPAAAGPKENTLNTDPG